MTLAILTRHRLSLSSEALREPVLLFGRDSSASAVPSQKGTGVPGTSLKGALGAAGRASCGSVAAVQRGRTWEMRWTPLCPVRNTVLLLGYWWLCVGINTCVEGWAKQVDGALRTSEHFAFLWFTCWWNGILGIPILCLEEGWELNSICKMLLKWSVGKYWHEEAGKRCRR